MGKSNKRTGDKSRVNPIAKPVKPPADPQLALLRETKIIPIINDLQDPDSKKRSIAATAIANLVDDQQCRKLLLREQIVRILLEQTTTDTSLESKSAGWGILRNLALEEEADFSIHLYRQDILTAISGIVKTLIETVQSQDLPVAKLPKSQQALLWTISASVTGLIASLAEAQDEIVEAINLRPVVVDFLFTLLAYDGLSEGLFNEILACLSALTEDNKNISQRIADHDSWFNGLMQLRKNGGLRAISACGVLHNIFSSLEWFDHNTPIPGACDATLVPTLVACVTNANTQQGVSSTPDQVLQLALAITASIATSLQEALEHASRNEKEFEGFGDNDDLDDSKMVEAGDSDNSINEDDNDVEGDEGEGDDDDDDDDDLTSEMEADMARVTGVEDLDEDSSKEQATLSALIRIATPALIPLVNSNDKDTRDNALSALNNISWILSSIDFNTSNLTLYEDWASLVQKMWEEAISPVLASNTADITLASSVASLAWALARSVQGQISIKPSEQRKFMALYQASRSLSADDSAKLNGDKASDAFQGLGVKCIGVLGSLALTPAPIELNREIGVFLFTALNTIPEMPVADMIEALNQLFDMYADKGYACDETFVKDGFLKHLESILPKARAAAKSVDKRKSTELRARADEAVLNLDRFIKYKKRERQH